MGKINLYVDKNTRTHAEVELDLGHKTKRTKNKKKLLFQNNTCFFRRIEGKTYSNRL